jgi:hypothetical protein
MKKNNQEMAALWKKRETIIKEIHNLKSKKEDIDKVFIFKFKNEYCKYNPEPIRTYFKVSVPYDSDWQYHLRTYPFEKDIDFVLIEFMDSREGEAWDSCIIPATHFDTGFTEDDLTSRESKLLNRQKVQHEKEERAQYELLKAKYEKPPIKKRSKK